MNKATFSFLGFGDIEANENSLEKLLDKGLFSYDFVLFTGDVPNPEVFRKLGKKMVEQGLGDLGNKPNIARETEPKEALEQVEKEFRSIKEFFKEIQKNTRFIGIWGNADNTKMLRKVPIERYIEIIHNKIIKIGEFYLIGYNGRPLYIFEKENKEQWAFPEKEAYNDLEKLFKKLKGEKIIFVTHAPPYRILDLVVEDYRKYGALTYGKRAKDGHIGSMAFKKIDEIFKPILHVFGHIHESMGMIKVGKTTFVNTGGIGNDLVCADIRIKDEKVRVNFINLDKK